MSTQSITTLSPRFKDMILVGNSSTNKISHERTSHGIPFFSFPLRIDRILSADISIIVEITFQIQSDNAIHIYIYMLHVRLKRLYRQLDIVPEWSLIDDRNLPPPPSNNSRIGHFEVPRICRKAVVVFYEFSSLLVKQCRTIFNSKRCAS